VEVAGLAGSPFLEASRGSVLAVRDDLRVCAQDPARWVLAVRRIRGLVGSGRWDVLLVFSGDGHLPLFLGRLGTRQRPLLVRARAEIRPPKPWPWNRWLHLHGTDRLLFSGRFMLKPPYWRWALPEGRFHVLPGGVDTERLAPGRWEREAAAARQRLGLRSGDLVLGIVARLSPVKGHAAALRGLAPVLRRHPRIHLLLVGPEAQLRWSDLAPAIPEPLRPRVHYVGRVPEAAPYMAACTLGIVPSLGSEAVCRVAMEWHALGIPVVGTDVHVIPEIVEDGRTGWIVPPGDAAALEGAVEAALADAGERARRGREARERAVRHFSLASLGTALERLLEGALEGRPWPPP
jgi:glycosyltransferase involved in cell wall biosynthesis